MKIAFIKTNKNEIIVNKVITAQDFNDIKNLKSYKSLIILDAESEEEAFIKYSDISKNF